MSMKDAMNWAKRHMRNLRSQEKAEGVKHGAAVLAMIRKVPWRADWTASGLEYTFQHRRADPKKRHQVELLLDKAWPHGYHASIRIETCDGEGADRPYCATLNYSDGEMRIHFGGMDTTTRAFETGDRTLRLLDFCTRHRIEPIEDEA